MSRLIVEVCTIDDVKPHNNADSLELCIVKGWQCVTQKGLHQKGDKIIYVPIDTVMPQALSDSMDVTKYLANGRVRCAKLRGEPSFGVIMKCADPTWEIGRDVAEHYGLTKYTPPTKVSAGNAETPHPLLQKYTEIENMRNFYDVFTPGEEVIITEKIHGSSFKLGILEGEWVAGSMEVRRKRPADDQIASNIYWQAYAHTGLRRIVEEFARTHKQVLIYGEAYGKVQNLSYDKPDGLGFAVFDMLVDGKYLSWDELATTCLVMFIPIVPVVARGPFSLDFVKQHSTGKTTFKADHVREGVVVKPVVERTDPKIGRVVLKYINDDYLLKKESGKITDVVDA